MKNATTDTDVLITKTVSATESVVTFSYQIRAPQSVSRLRLVEQLPAAVDPTAVDGSTADHGEWTVETAHTVAFVSEQPPTDPIETSVQIHSETLDPHECVSELTTHTESPTDDSLTNETLTPSVNITETTHTGSGTLDTDGGEHRANGRERSAIRTNGSQTVRVGPSVAGSTAEKQELPAVGILATRTDHTVARTIVRATQHGLSVFVVDDDTASTNAQIARRLGATVVEKPAGVDDGSEQESVLRQAIGDDCPGLVLCETAGEPIDIEASVAAFEASEQRVVEMVPESAQTNVLVGIPAYNEAATIGTVVEAAKEYADEVLVVDDGSTDQTADCARAAGATVVEHDRNRGYGCGLKTIFQEANRRDVDALVIIDGDDQHDVKDIPRLLETQRESGAEIVIGNRFGESAGTKMPLYRRFGSGVITLLLNLSIGNVRPSARIQDAQSGFRSYSATAVQAIAEHPNMIDDGMSASTDILYYANTQGFTTEEVPTTISYDVSNAHTRHPITHGLNIVNRIFTTLEQNRPVTVLGIPGFCAALIGIGLGYWSVSTYVASGTLVPSSVALSVLFILLGTISVVVSAVQYSLNVSLDGLGHQRL